MKTFFSRTVQALVRFATVGLVLGSLCFAANTHAALITVDENGNGTIGGGSLRPDPGPGGLPSVLTYNLPFAATQGDVALSSTTEPGFVGLPVVFDYIRFNGNGTLDFYSDNVPIADSLGDTPSPPLAFYPNLVTISEVGPEGNNSATYTPTAGQPGFDPSGPTYHFISDGVAAVPEPASIAILGAGLLGVAFFSRRRRG
jgi:hypothetical protein